MVIHYASDEAVRTVASHPRQLVGSDGIFGARPHPRLYGTAPRFLGRFVARDGLLPVEEAKDTCRYLARMLGVGGDSRAEEAGLLFLSARRLMECLGAVRPTLILFEDIHWAKPSELQLLEYLARQVEDTSVVFMALARPELLPERQQGSFVLAAHARPGHHDDVVAVSGRAEEPVILRGAPVPGSGRAIVGVGVTVPAVGCPVARIGCPVPRIGRPVTRVRNAVSPCGVAGFVVARTLVPGESEILNLAVAPEFRRQGVARALIEAWLRDFPGTVFLEVRASNKTAQKAYKFLGFQEVIARPGYYDSGSESGIVMKFHSC